MTKEPKTIYKGKTFYAVDNAPHNDSGVMYVYPTLEEAFDKSLSIGKKWAYKIEIIGEIKKTAKTLKIK